ncbi:MAG TPA: 16S rRNA (cytosine(967)-C(5))-methyltransferase RsmB [Solimonas sp.]|nr:16S rRNA (cytosine(967)-C(5))-methyltransferase RsmB [Solimonas sp.]
MKPSQNSRVNAARIVARVMLGHSLDDCYASLPAELPDLPFTKALVYGVIRDHSLLSALLDRLLDKPLSPDPLLHALLLCGLYQLRSMDVADHAALNETVEATGELKFAPARGLVNAVLRRYQREGKALELQLPADPALRSSHPDWLAGKLEADWPHDWERVLAANNRQGPMTLRVNRREMSRDTWLQRAQEIGIGAQALDDCPDAVMLDEPRPVTKIPGFNAGHVSVQDASAQLAVELMDLRYGQRVLDACAAPGGKTAHMLERQALQLTALDNDSRRLVRIDENLRRLKLHAGLVAGDAGTPAKWWDRKLYDRILIDAPCSGTGVIRRHPDIKWLRRKTDVPALQLQQLRLLKALWPLLAPGGRLVYATCSTLRSEGDEVMSRFLSLSDDQQATKIDASWGEATEFGRRIAPGDAHDGFYYAVLDKPA